jgi:hypothetical protein
MLDSLILAYLQFMIMLLELQKCCQELKRLSGKTATVLSEGTVPKTTDESLSNFYALEINKYIVYIYMYVYSIQI